MMQILSRSLAMVFAVGLVGASGWALSRPYFQSVFGSWGHEIIVCDCFDIPPVPFSAEWPQFDAGTFRIKAPDGVVLQKVSATSGFIRDPRFTLTYSLSERVRDDTFAKTGLWFRESDAMVGGKPGVVRTATFGDRDDSEYLEFIVPRAVKAKDGRWLTLEIRGWTATYERRWLAEQVVTSVSFTPPYDIAVVPVRPRVVSPTIEIDYPSQRNAQ